MLRNALSDERVLQNSNGAVVTAEDVTRCYGEGDTRVDALRGVTLDVARGKLTAVMGPSGSGKSTLMHILAALDKPTSGTVTIDGTDVTTLGDTQLTKLRRKHIGFVFQFFNLLPMLTAEENVRLPLTIAGTKPDKEFFEDLLQKVGPHRPPFAPSERVVRRAAAAGRHRPRARVTAHGRVCRRADGQPRLSDVGRDPRPHARIGR